MTTRATIPFKQIVDYAIKRAIEDGEHTIIFPKAKIGSYLSFEDKTNIRSYCKKKDIYTKDGNGPQSLLFVRKNG